MSGILRHNMQELRELLAGRLETAPLDVVALQIATLEYPEVSVEPFLSLLDSYASEFGERITASTPGDEFIPLLNEYLFDELGFQGNDTDYYNPANSCLNEVLIRRTGIPITLSLVYIELARRLGRVVHGIGLPGHFLVQFVDNDFRIFLDPFHAGRILSPEECYEIASAATGVSVPEDSELLQPAPARQIAVRMLNNLRGVYFRRQDAAKAVRVLDLFIEAVPFAVDEYRQRGACRAQLQHFEAARTDFETYLRLAPDAPDRQAVQAQLEQIRKHLSAG